MKIHMLILSLVIAVLVLLTKRSVSSEKLVPNVQTMHQVLIVNKNDSHLDISLLVLANGN